MPPISLSLSDELARGNTRENRDRLTRWVGRNEQRLGELMELYLHGDRRDAQLAAGVVTLVADEHPEMMDPWLPAMVERMEDRSVHNAVVRTGMHVLQVVDVPRRIAGKVAKVCFDALEDVSQPIAVRVFAMTVLVNLCVGRKRYTAGGPARGPIQMARSGRPFLTCRKATNHFSNEQGNRRDTKFHQGRTKLHEEKKGFVVEPELAREVELAITTVLPYGTAAFSSRAKHELRRLESLRPHTDGRTKKAPDVKSQIPSEGDSWIP